MNVQQAKSTAGRLRHKIETLIRRQQGALLALGVRLVIATLWKLSVLRSPLTLTPKRMASVAAQVTSSTSTKFRWLSDEPGAKKRSVQQRTNRTKNVMRAARLF